MRSKIVSNQKQTLSVAAAVLCFAVLFSACPVGGADKSVLNAAITGAETLLDSVTASADGTGLAVGAQWATAADRSTLNAAITAARAVSNNDAATQDEVDAAVTDLAAARAAFELKISTVGSAVKTALGTAIGNAQTLLGSVTASADGAGLAVGAQWAIAADRDTFQTAINNAQTVFNNAAAIQTQVDAAVTALAAAKTTFEGQIQTAVEVVNKSALETAITNAGTQLGSVTASADGNGLAFGVQWAIAADRSAFQTAITNAQTVADNAAATQIQVDAAVTALAAAKTTFDGKINTSTGPWKLITADADLSIGFEDPAGGSDKAYKLAYASGQEGDGFYLDLASLCANFPADYTSADRMLTVSYKLFVPKLQATTDNGFIDIATGRGNPGGWSNAGAETFGRLHFYRDSTEYNIVGGQTATNAALPSDVRFQSLTGSKHDQWVTITAKIDLGVKKVFALKYGDEEWVTLLGTATTLNNGELYLKVKSSGAARTPNGTVFYIKDVSVTYAVETFAITQGTVSGGTLNITPNPAKAGETVTIAGTPTNAGDVLSSITVDGAIGLATTNNLTYTFTMPAKALTVTGVEFSGKNAVTAAITNYTAAPPASLGTRGYTKLGGKVTVSPSTAGVGETVTITAAPFPGYKVVSYSVKDTSDVVIGSVTVNPADGTFTMPNQAVVVDAVFGPDTGKVILYFADIADNHTDLNYCSEPSGNLRQGTWNGVGGVGYVRIKSLFRFDGVNFTDLKRVTTVAKRNNANAISWVLDQADVTDTVTPGTTTAVRANDDTYAVTYLQPTSDADNPTAFGTGDFQSNTTAIAIGGTNYFANTFTLTHSKTGSLPFYFYITHPTETGTGNMNDMWYLVLDYNE
ncbi:hypothetical protein AGMMS49991_03740 [Spirochaetia bacterium]|nr:hypothetical protein AGMMS49991_03740 [Spirochaetia bacterium]